jgi:Domain of unknown function (DUF4389)
MADEHPIRLSVTDDLERSRLTVLFRWLLAIPHYVWLAVWGIAAFFAVIANWVCTLVLGRSPGALHRFLAAYVKYVTQLYAYLNLAANPYPQFDGRPGYPVDVMIADPVRQRRWTVAIRGLLALPAVLIAGALTGEPNGLSGPTTGTGTRTAHHQGFHLNFVSFGGLVHIVALLAWFVAIARARSPRGLRDAAAYGIGYGAQLWSYLFLLTDRYPECDPQTLIGELPVRSDPVALSVQDDRKRSRLTVFFRLLLTLPHLVWLVLWLLAALLATIANWFVLLVRGRPAAPLHRFLSAFVRYGIHVNAFLMLVANPFPGFVGAVGSYPVETTLPAAERQNRWKVLARLPLAIPALLISGAYSSLLNVTALLGWFVALARGEVPRGMRNAGALALRYQAQVAAYVLLLTDSYPYTGPIREGSSAAPQPGEETQSAPPAGEAPNPFGGPALEPSQP